LSKTEVFESLETVAVTSFTALVLNRPRIAPIVSPTVSILLPSLVNSITRPRKGQ